MHRSRIPPGMIPLGPDQMAIGRRHFISGLGVPRTGLLPSPHSPETRQEVAVEARFEEIVTTWGRLCELYKLPVQKVTNNTINHIDEICRRFIAASSFVMVASRGADGRLDLSPKGDAAGFVAVLDEKTLAIPDRPGNNRLDTFENLLTHPEVGLFFIIPGHEDTLRVSGKGWIVRDSSLQRKCMVNGRTSNVVLVVSVEEAFMHCPKCMIRSSLWSPALWPDQVDVATYAEAKVAHGAPTKKSGRNAGPHQR
jgi:uncharacterized protein